MLRLARLLELARPTVLASGFLRVSLLVLRQELVRQLQLVHQRRRRLAHPLALARLLELAHQPRRVLAHRRV